jgi:hypothetical protein
LRKELKKREARKGIKNTDKDGTKTYVEDDRFEDVSKDVKKLLRYRNKTISNLEATW